MARLVMFALVAIMALSGCILEEHGYSGRNAGGCCTGCGAAPASAAPAPSGPSSSQQYVYRCTMDGGERDTPGPCPKCGMTLDDRYLVPK